MGFIPRFQDCNNLGLSEKLTFFEISWEIQVIAFYLHHSVIKDIISTTLLSRIFTSTFLLSRRLYPPPCYQGDLSPPPCYHGYYLHHPVIKEIYLHQPVIMEIYLHHPVIKNIISTTLLSRSSVVYEEILQTTCILWTL